jgi:CHAT domain-containing protein/tetratricopeptide (TPR) repeat protein
MLTRLTPTYYLTQDSRRIIALILLLLVVNSVNGQDKPTETLAKADTLFAEAVGLFQQGNKVSFETAAGKFEEAASLYSLVHEQAKEIRSLVGVGGCYNSLGEPRKSIDYFLRALTIARAVGDQDTEATLVAIIGGSYSDLGENQKALEYLTQALPFFHKSGNRESEGLTLVGIGTVYTMMGESRKALEYYEQALPLLRLAGSRNGEGKALSNLGSTYSSIGEPQKALDYLAQALTLFKATDDRSSEAGVFTNSGTIYLSLGEKQKALDNFNQALLIFRALGNRAGEAIILNDLGLAYSAMGEKQKALGYLSQSLEISRARADRGTEATSLDNIGMIYSELGEPRKSLGYYAEALPLLRANNLGHGEASTLNNMAKAYSEMGEKQTALTIYAQALILLRKMGDREGEAYLLNNIAVNYYELGDTRQALDYLNQALTLRREVGHREGEASTLYNIATIERDQDQLAQSLEHIKSAVEIIESLRTKIQSDWLRSSYFANAQDSYELYIELLMRLSNQQRTKGFDKTALQVNERRRARSLLDVLSEANGDIRQGISLELVERERSLQKQLNAKAQLQMKLLSGLHTVVQAEMLSKELDGLTTEFQQVETLIRQTSPQYAALTQPQPLTLKEIQTQVLDADTLLLEYSLGKNHSYLWAVTPDSIMSYELPKREVIEAAARPFYNLLNARNKHVKGETQSEWQARVAQSDGEIPAAAARLSQLLLAPVAAQLGRKRIAIVADGILQYIPFAALPTPSAGVNSAAPQPLIVEHEIVALPSASTLSVIRREVSGRKPAPKGVVALADPVFTKNDERVKRGTLAVNERAKEIPARGDAESVRALEIVEAADDTGVSSEGLYIPRLPGSRQEAEEIVAMVPVTESRLVLDFEASRSVATSVELSQYRYVHFSTHGFLNSVHPELSGIVLSLVNERGEEQDGFLRAHEVFNLKLPAEVVVLSACQTGIGKEVRGEGLISLTRGFMYAGAPRVVVSLWSVSEIGTSELMVRFYREMLKGGKRPAAALRAAQLSLMKEKRWQSPFYWAAFTLQGEWR